MIPQRYAPALADLFTYQMGDSPAGAPRFFIARTWVTDYKVVENNPVVWLINSINRHEAVECCTIVRNILNGIADDISDFTINENEQQSIMSRLSERVAILDMDAATDILYEISVPLTFSENIHGAVNHIDVIPFTVESGFDREVVEFYSTRIPVYEN